MMMYIPIAIPVFPVAAMYPPAKANANAQPAGRRVKQAQSTSSVCLDYLKGQCVRPHCKYLHPDLTEFYRLAQEAEVEGKAPVCDVWVLTGRCKFGSKCTKQHPALAKLSSSRSPECVSDVSVHEKCANDVPPEAVSIIVPRAKEDRDAEFEDFADSILKTLDETKWEEDEELDLSCCKAALGKDIKCKGKTSWASFAFDNIFIDIMKDLHIVSF